MGSQTPSAMAVTHTGKLSLEKYKDQSFFLPLSYCLPRALGKNTGFQVPHTTHSTGTVLQSNNRPSHTGSIWNSTVQNVRKKISHKISYGTTNVALILRKERQNVPIGRPRTWSTEGRANRNLLVSWLTSWKTKLTISYLVGIFIVTSPGKSLHLCGLLQDEVFGRQQ